MWESIIGEDYFGQNYGGQDSSHYYYRGYTDRPDFVGLGYWQILSKKEARIAGVGQSNKGGQKSSLFGLSAERFSGRTNWLWAAEEQTIRNPKNRWFFEK